MRQLVITDRHHVSVAEGDVSGLADRIAQEAIGQIVIAVLSGLGLDGGVVAQGVDADQHGVKNSQFSDGGDVGLEDDGGFVGIQADGKIIHSHLIDAVADQFRTFEMGSQCLDVGRSK